MDALERLKADFSGHIAFRERRPGIVQVVAPLFHEDGDMVDIFIDLPHSESEPIRISDHGMTLMRLSYSYEIDSPTKQKVLDRILSENGISESHGRLYIDTQAERVYPALLQFAQVLAKVSNMQAFKREVIHNLFYETLNDFVFHSLSKYNPSRRYLPIPEQDAYEVDWRFEVRPRDIYLYGVRGDSKARLAALACREFQLRRISFRSVIVHEDFESGLSKKDQARITNTADKQFTSLGDFQQNAESFFEREIDSLVVQ